MRATSSGARAVCRVMRHVVQLVCVTRGVMHSSRLSMMRAAVVPVRTPRVVRRRRRVLRQMVHRRLFFIFSALLDGGRLGLALRIDVFVFASRHMSPVRVVSRVVRGVRVTLVVCRSTHYVSSVLRSVMPGGARLLSFRFL